MNSQPTHAKQKKKQQHINDFIECRDVQQLVLDFHSNALSKHNFEDEEEEEGEAKKKRKRRAHHKQARIHMNL